MLYTEKHDAHNDTMVNVRIQFCTQIVGYIRNLFNLKSRKTVASFRKSDLVTRFTVIVVQNKFIRKHKTWFGFFFFDSDKRSIILTSR